MPALTMKKMPRPAIILTKQKIEEQIRCRACELYEERGREDGDELASSRIRHHWEWHNRALQPKAALSVFRLLTDASPLTNARRNSMSEHKCKALILDSDADALIELQR